MVQVGGRQVQWGGLRRLASLAAVGGAQRGWVPLSRMGGHGAVKYEEDVQVGKSRVTAAVRTIYEWCIAVLRARQGMRSFGHIRLDAGQGLVTGLGRCGQGTCHWCRRCSLQVHGQPRTSSNVFNQAFALPCPAVTLPAPRYGYNYVNACSIKLEMLLADVAAAFTGAGDTVVHELFLQVGGRVGGWGGDRDGHWIVTPAVASWFRVCGRGVGPWGLVSGAE